MGKHVVQNPDGSFSKVDDDDSAPTAPPASAAPTTPPKVVPGKARDRGKNLQDLVDEMAGTPSNAGKQSQSTDHQNSY